MVSSRLEARSKQEEDNKLAEPVHNTPAERSMTMQRSLAMNKSHKTVERSLRRRIHPLEQDEL